MYIFLNAIKNIARNKGRNMLMGIIILAIIFTVAVSMIITATTSAVIEDYKQQFGSEVALTYNREKMPSIPTDFKQPASEQLLEFGKSDLLQKTEFTASVKVALEGSKALGEEGQQIPSGVIVEGGGGNKKETDYISPKASVIASSNKELGEDFTNGFRRIVSGKLFENPNEVLVSQDFAKLNGLKPGDKITIKSTSKSAPMKQALTISGIYEDNTPPDPALKEMNLPFLNRGNEILGSLETVTGLELFHSDKVAMEGIVDAKYFLKDPAFLPQFQQELTAKGLPEYYKAATDEAGYQRVVGPVEGLGKIARTLMVVVLVLGSLILILLSSLAVRERKYEIGILRAMGMKKGKVALGLVSEMFIITTLCLFIGLGAGSAASQRIADNLLSGQVEQASQQEMPGSESFGTSPGKQAITDIEINLSGKAAGGVIGISLLLVGMSSMAGIWLVTKYEPRKILTERN